MLDVHFFSINLPLSILHKNNPALVGPLLFLILPGHRAAGFAFADFRGLGYEKDLPLEHHGIIFISYG